MSRFVDTHIFRDQRLSLGIDRLTDGHFLSTPISTSVLAAEFEGWFAITPDEYRAFIASPEIAAEFAEDCRMGRHFARRIEGPHE